MPGRRRSALQTIKHCAHMSESLFHWLENVTLENAACLLLIESRIIDLNVPSLFSNVIII